MGFLHFTIIDFIDILLVAYIMYELYRIIKGTVALDLFILILVLYFIYMLIKLLHMKLLSSILGNSIAVGIMAILIVFQQEVKRFLLSVRHEYKLISEKIEQFLTRVSGEKMPNVPIYEIIEAVEYIVEQKLGAIIVIARQNDLKYLTEKGIMINALVNAELLKTIFLKNSPLHDGASILSGNHLLAVSCILPITEKTDLPKFLGMRHRAALGISEDTDAFVIVVSEERQEISYAEFGQLFINIGIKGLREIMEKYFLY